MRTYLIPVFFLALAAGCSADRPSPAAGSANATTSGGATSVAASSSFNGSFSPSSVAQAASAPSAPRSPPSSFASLPDHGQLLAYDRTARVKRAGAYTAYPVTLSEEHALRAMETGELAFTAPNGAPVRLKFERVIEHPDGNWTWVGRNEQGVDGLLTFGEKAVFGSIPQGQGNTLRLTTQSGQAYLVETDPDKLPPGAGPGQENDFLIPPPAPPASGSTTTQSAALPFALAVPPPDPEVDVLLGYTNGYAAQMGGASQVSTRLVNLIDVTNQAYINSGVSMRVRLVDTVLVNYPDNTSNQDTLGKLTGQDSNGPKPTDPAFSGLRTARETTGADLVSLVRALRTPENGGCGLAWLIGFAQTPYTAASEGSGYSIVADGTDLDEADGQNYHCRDETLAHELGHNMGQAHDPATSPGNRGHHLYSNGYREVSSTGFYTVMAYPDGAKQFSIRYFANPNVSFSGRPTGVAGVSDNVRSLDLTMPIAATFRATVVANPDPPPAPGSSAPTYDFDGDGKSDLLLQNNVLGMVAYWAMNGATPTRYSPAFDQPSGYTLVATGDFNGDRKVDVVWARESDRALLLWQSDGSGFSQLPLRSYSAGWKVVGAGDIDGNGKSDLVLENAAQGLAAYWIMDSATPTRYSPAFVSPSGFSRAAMGDFNGDGKLDLVWARKSDRALLLWQGDGNGFTQANMGAHPADFTVDGAGDIDGDGKSDLLLTNDDGTQFSYWIMNGASLVRTGLTAIPAGYSRVATGDFNGDGNLDLVFARASDRALVMLRGTGTSFTQLFIRLYSNGWRVVNETPPGDVVNVVPGSGFVRGDVDGDGKSDFFLHNDALSANAYWIMNAAVPARYSPVFSRPAGYTHTASGDFNGDGKLDIVWSRASDRALILWQGDGTGFTTITIREYSLGWQVVGAGDIDGDGKSDLLLENESQGLAAYWIMNGATPVRYSPAFIKPPGFIQAAIGDLNGDGRLDVVWARASDRSVLLWQGDGAGFSSISIGTTSAGWVIDGAGDIDGDGKSDLLLTNQGLTAYWIMSGSAVARYSSVFTSPSGYSRAAAGDYNGDGKLDLVWARASDRSILMWQGNGNGFTSLPVGNSSAGWMVGRL